MTRMLAVLMGLALLGGLVGAWVTLGRPSAELVEEARLALKRRNYSQAEEQARRWLQYHPQDADVLLLLGETLQRQGRLSEAIRTYAEVPLEAGPQSVAARLATASIFISQGKLEEAETKLRSLSDISGPEPYVDGLWVTLLTLSGQRWDSLPHLKRTLRTVGDPLIKLIYLANPDEMPAPPEDVFERMFAVRDPLGLLGCARAAAALGRGEQALRLAGECLQQRADLLDAHILRASLLMDQGEIAAVRQLLAQLPASADRHPGIWFLRGRFLQDTGEDRTAIRCYWEVLKRQPNHDRATYQIGQLLAKEKRVDEARLFQERAGRLTKLIETSVRLYENRGAVDDIELCMNLTLELGRLRECRSWCEYQLHVAPGNTVAVARLSEVMVRWSDELPWVLPEHDLARRIDLSSYPPPQFSTSSEPASDIKQSETVAKIRFEDFAERVGIHFQYFNGDDPVSEGKRMFEYTGGGVAAFDYDMDGWTDLYFTQGSEWPPSRTRTKHLDVLYRNGPEGSAIDATVSANISDGSFGQGVAVGDYDNDGFPDLYVANMDGNRLHKNNGDGTFTEVTESCGLGRHKFWTTSCLLADINGDSLPDVFDVTFLEGDQIFSHICRGEDGVARSCAPAGFPAAPDQVYLNRDGGVFEDVSKGHGFEVGDGDGLGIVAADYDRSGKIGLFVGNDGRANHFFTLQPSSTSGVPRWEEVGVLSGLAFDDAGAAQACMGIAAGDANGDGLLDLFVTNFYHESNALYVNLGGSFFSDRARSTGLREPSWEKLGFGAQFLDADADGWEDLVLTNGHVDDFTHKQIPYKMASQFFWNRRGRFLEQTASEVGDCFSQLRLGRGLARLDWNRDGRTDFVVSNIGDPAALLINQTQSAGHVIGVRLSGTSGSRDAIGTRVVATLPDRTLERQLTAGDGYQASNERRLEFGLGEATVADFAVHWPGGLVQRFERLGADQEYLFVEGHPAAIQLPRN